MTTTWVKKPIEKDYDFEGKIIEFSSQQHNANALFCRCDGGFGSKSYCTGTMILGNFYPTLQEAIDDKGGDDVGGNTRCFPIAQYEEVEA